MLIIGHRGAPEYAPENTLVSFKKAIDLGVDMIEFDVRVCKSGEIIICHDKRLTRLNGDKELIKEKTLTELKAINLGGGEKIPTLEEALDLIDHRVKINIELKSRNATIPLISVIKKYIKQKGWPEDYFLITSYHYGKLKAIKKILPGLRVGMRIRFLPLHLAIFPKRIKAYSVSLNYKYFVKKIFIDNLKKRGIKIFAYVVNDKKSMEKMRRMGVDGIFSDYPDRLQ